ncbi:beta-secretase 1-like isoform X1 [Asterias amurensis]|uniref:beta-secretase 1-like isoform X1 n=2 Tax=Asterias amurensis TaxID=7602 RepID=UPI003AB57C7D
MRELLMTIIIWTLLLLHLCFHFVSVQADVLRLPLHTSRHQVNDEVRSKGKGDIYDTPRDNLKGKPGLGFYVEIELGTPKQKLNVLVDTGSSNFAVAASPNIMISKYFHKENSSTYHDLNREVYVPYTQGEWRGELGEDLVSIPVSHPNVSVKVNVASITHSEEFFINESNWQGILGLAYAEIARPDSTVLPFFDSLVQQSGIEDIFSLQLCGLANTTGNSSRTNVTGTMTIGGLDKGLYKGVMWFTPTRNNWYYEVIILDIEVNGRSLNMDCKEYNFDKTIVDSGTTNLRLPTRVFEALKLIINETVSKLIDEPIPDNFWTGEELICHKHSTEPWVWFPSLAILLNSSPNTAFRLKILSRQYLRLVDSDKNGEHCYKYGISSSTTGSVIGAVVLEGFYVVFDRANQSVGFAKSSCAYEFEIGSMSPGVEGPIAIVATDCGYIAPPTDNLAVTIAMYVMAGLCVVCLIPLFLMYVHNKWVSCRRKSCENDNSELLEERTDSTETDALKDEQPQEGQSQPG